MKSLLAILFFLSMACQGQSETHNFITYDTSFSSTIGLGEAWNARISRPANLFTLGNADTASRPLIIMIPGQGQMGSSDTNLLTQYGPHYWMNNAWDGGVQLGNGRHFPIIVTLSAVTNTIPSPVQYYPILKYIVQHYHIKPGCIYGTGFSEGAFTQGGEVEYEDTIGNQKGMKLLNALACFEGTPSVAYFTSPSWPTPYPNSSWADTAYFATWATTYGGKFFYLEGSGSDNFRDGWHYANAMNDVVPKSAYFSYEDAGGGAHCCWNQMYDPSDTNWTSVGTLGPLNSPSQAGTNTMGDYTSPGNVYQWMLRQGDTSLVGGGNGIVSGGASPCSVYYWDSTNISIAITKANFPHIHPCDTIYIDSCQTQAGYRSIVIKLSADTPWLYSTQDSNYINIIARNGSTYGTIKTNSTGNLFANSIDSSLNLHIKGIKMYDHTDPLFFNVTQTGYLHHIKFEKDTLQNIPGLWGSGPISTSLPNFTGTNDTVNCNYDLKFHECVFDSIGNTSFGGLVAMWLGGFNKNQVFVRTEIDSCIFNYAPSPSGSGPACYVHCQQCFLIKIHDNTVTNLGVVATPQGHAASFFMQASLFDVYHNFFKGDFSNCVRAISQATVPGMASLFATWDPNYDGVPRFWGNILDSGRKYPMIEDQKDTIAISSLPYAVPVRSARVWNNTMYRGGMGAGDQPYNVSVYDWYEVSYTNDTVEMHNNTEVGPPSDTTSGVFCYSTYCYSLLTRPSGTTAFYDTSGNQFSQSTVFSNSGLADTVQFYPIKGGILYNNGVSVPAWLNKDFYGQTIPATGRASFARNTGVDVGAVMLQLNGIPIKIPYGYRIKTN